jgi:2-C-methyl-D-erythritol 4-phosphate cytidylyltransferase
MAGRLVTPLSRSGANIAHSGGTLRNDDIAAGHQHIEHIRSDTVMIHSLA